jgi:hypothetical protein
LSGNCGVTFGQDSDGNRWTTSRWRDTDITTVEPRPEQLKGPLLPCHQTMHGALEFTVLLSQA